MKKVLVKINGLLSGKLKWAIFGGVAVAIHDGNLYRDFNDVDIVIENDKNKIISLLNEYEVCFKTRRGRERAYLTIGEIKIELLFLTDENELDLADGKFKFHNIERIKFNNLELPVIDLQSLYCAKLRHKQFLEKENVEEHKDKLKNTNIDLNILERLINTKRHANFTNIKI
ncbi:MAG: hypothetical protein NTW73_03230 [Candidatus Parcubacteria bacterium]|nr:hypothetical protein [Candidatus Parcubacteria bacterium]